MVTESNFLNFVSLYNKLQNLWIRQFCLFSVHTKFLLMATYGASADAEPAESCSSPPLFLHHSHTRVVLALTTIVPTKYFGLLLLILPVLCFLPSNCLQSSKVLFNLKVHHFCCIHSTPAQTQHLLLHRYFLPFNLKPMISILFGTVDCQVLPLPLILRILQCFGQIKTRISEYSFKLCIGTVSSMCFLVTLVASYLYG